MLRSLKQRILKTAPYVQMLLALVMAAFVSMAVVSYIFVNKIERKHWREDAGNMLSNMAAQIEFDLLEPQSSLSNTAQFLKEMILHGHDEEHVLEVLGHIEDNTQNDEVRKFRTFGAYGLLEFFGGDFFCTNWSRPEGYNPQERPWYKTAIEAGDKVGVTKPYKSARGGETVISFTRRVYDDNGNPLFIMCLDALMSKIIEYVSNMRFTEDSYGILLNEKMEFIAHPNEKMLNASSRNVKSVISTLAKDLEFGEEISERESVNYKGKETIVFFKPLKNGWYLGLVIPKNEYYRSSRNIAVFLIILGIISASILSIILISVLKIKEKANKRVQIMLDSAPLCINFWDRKFKLIDCNQEAVNFFGFSSKQEYMDKFHKLSPESQPDGSLSNKKVLTYAKKVFREGYCRFEWVHQKLNGEAMPCEVTLVLLKYEEDYIVAGYMRDLRETKLMMEEIERRSNYSYILNRVAAILLADYDEKTFEKSLLKSFEFVGFMFEADRVQIWRNEMIDGELNFVLRYEWLSEHGKKCVKVPEGFCSPYSSKPDWYNKFLRSKPINTPISAMSKEDQDFLCRYEIKAIVMLPIFLHGDFWGFFSIDDCQRERSFSNEEINVLNSTGLMMSHAINRNMQAIKIREAGERMEFINHWYKSILNTIPFPITVTDSETKWTFVNTAVENFLNVKLENIIGKPCSNWNATICQTPNCGIECVKRGIKQTYFQHEDLSYRVDVEVLKDLDGKTSGFVEVVQDITELEKMIKRQMEAESMNRAKSIFLARISHEIRTPMNVILGITEIQFQNKELDIKSKEAFMMIYNSADLLLRIINDLLDLSKIEAGKMELISAKYEIASLISDVMQLNFVYKGSKQIEFELGVDENIPSEFIGDELRIKQILNNLLSNAFKYTEKGTIKLLASVEQGENSDVALVFRISDTGHGMTEKQIHKIFDEYSRFSLTDDRSIEGTGLGMSITQNLVNLMGGKISVESEVGKGSVFTVYLPQKMSGTNVLNKEIIENLQKFRITTSRQAKKTQIAYKSMPYGSVLVVDDTETNIYVMQGFLAPYELSVDTVRSGFEAINKINSGKIYDIIFMDHMMPKMDGIEAVKIIREKGYANPIVALTANAIVGQTEIFLNNGFDDFISKPVDSHQLDVCLKKFIRNKYARVQNFQINAAMLTAFIHDAKRTAPEMHTMLENIDDASEEDLLSFTINAHSMKSILASIGETDVSVRAAMLEKAGNDHDKDFIKTNTHKFLVLLEKIILRIESEILLQ